MKISQVTSIAVINVYYVLMFYFIIIIFLLRNAILALSYFVRPSYKYL